MNARFHLSISLSFLGFFLNLAQADERTHSPEQLEQLASTGNLSEEEPVRPSDLPDLTKGDPLPVGKKKPKVWSLGPTGVAGIMAGGFGGDQLLVEGTLKGSPAEGLILPGDVITGVNGQKFNAGEHLGVTIGNAIIESELEENKGKFTFSIWRDLNYVKRNAAKNLGAVDIDDLFQEARDDNTLYDWKPEEARTEEVRQMGFDEFPLKPTTLEVELTLRTFPPYSDTAPYDCPKTQAILEDAWKVLEKKFIADPNKPRSGRGGIIEAIALLASGKPEHRKIVQEWVRSPRSPWKPPTDEPGDMLKPGYKGYKGYQSWHHGYGGLYCAIYYDATGDDYVLPALRKYAINTALGQSKHGSWGHTFAFPSFNGGEYNMMNPGYGALNAAGNRCFFLVVLAQKLGIEHPAIDRAVERGRHFFSSYIDQGCIPYGDHGAYGSDDSNGKNTGIAFGLKLLGDEYGSRYFAMMSAHCAFTRRGGHAHDYHGNWSSWAASLLGPEIRAYNERNLRWRRTLARLHDGSFVYDGDYGPLRDPTATHVLHQAAPLKQTLITGKDLDESWFMTEREMKQMFASARPQFNDPKLIEMAGTPWPERTTNEIFDLLDIFYPKARQNMAKELGKRYQAGESEILPRLLELLSHESARYRDGALRALHACGEDAVLTNLTKLIPLLNDDHEVVRISAAKAISLGSHKEDARTAMLEAAAAPPKAAAPNSLRNFLQAALFAADTPLANRPFESEADQETLLTALEEAILLDPSKSKFLSSRAGAWDKETVVRLAGTLVYAAEEEQVADQMFANRSEPARSVLEAHGYFEAPESSAHRLRKNAVIPRHIRPLVSFKRPMVDAMEVMQRPEVFKELLPAIEIAVIDNPNEKVGYKENPRDKKSKSIPIRALHETITKAGDKESTAPRIAADVAGAFDAELAAIEGSGAKIKHCSKELHDLTRHNSFRKIAAMDRLAEYLGPDAVEFYLPYLNHEYWRLREHSLLKASEAIRLGGAALLAGQFDPEQHDQAIGILAAFAHSGDKAGIQLADAALKGGSPELRRQALKTLATLEGTAALGKIQDRLNKTEADIERTGCEEAFLILADQSADSVRDLLIPLLPELSPENRASAWYVLASIGDNPSLDVLEAAGDTKSRTEFANLVTALSYSPSRRADDILLDFARTDDESAQIVGKQAVRRLVLGPKGYGDTDDEQRMDFAEPMIKLAMDRGLIDFLAYIHSARALRSLLYCLENGVDDAAEALIVNAETSAGYSPADARIAAETLRNVIEFIEVTQLRGGVSGKDWKKYPVWKALQARAGKVLLKVHQPEAEPIPTFDTLDFDI